MADTTTKVLEVIVDNNKAVASIAQYNRLIDEQKEKQRQLAEEYKQGKISQEDYYRAIAQSKEEIKTYTRSIQELSKEIQNNVKDAQEQEGSLRSLRAQLSNLTKEYDALSRAERNGEAGRAKMEEINRITNELKEAEEETQRFYRNVGNYPDVKPLETQLGEIKKRLAELKYAGEDTSDEFRELSAQAANMKDALMDVEQQINSTASDSKKLDTAIVGLNTAMGGLSLMSHLFADGSEQGKKLAEILQKVQLVMVTLNTLRMIQNNLQKQGLLYQAAEKVRLAAVNVQKKLHAALTAKQTAATQAQTVAQKGLNAVMKAGPVLLITGALAGLAAIIHKVAKAFDSSSDNVKAQTKSYDQAKKAMDEYSKALDRTLTMMDKLGKSDASKMQAQLQGLIDLAGQAKDLFRSAQGLDDERIKEAEQAYKDARVSLNDYVEGLRSEVQTMGEMFDMMKQNEGLQEFEIEILSNNSSISEWTKLLTNLLSIGKITSAEADKAIRYLTEKADKANKELLEKAYKEQIKQQKALLDERLSILRSAQSLEFDLMKEGAEKARAIEQARYEQVAAEIYSRRMEAALKLKGQELVMQLQALDNLLAAETKLHTAKMAALFYQEGQEEVDAKVAKIKLELEAVEEGVQKELELQLQLLQAEEDSELTYTRKTEEEKELIRAKYRKKEAELRKNAAQEANQKEMEQLRLFWQNQIDEAALNKQNTLELEMQARKAELDALHQMEGESDAEFKARQLEKQKAYVDAKKALDDYEVEITQAKMSAIEGLMGGLSQIIEAFGETNEKAAKAAKAIALAEIAINTGKAIAAGVAQAQSVAFPANIAAIATTVTTVLTNIASAISTVKSAKFATGGFVSGPGTGTSDSIPARLSNGESVINARSTAMFGPLLSSLNQAGGGIAFNPATGGQREGYEFLAAAVSAGMKSVRLHVGVDEVTRVQDRVARINEVSTIG